MTIHISDFWFGVGVGIVATFLGSFAVVATLLEAAKRKGEEE